MIVFLEPYFFHNDDRGGIIGLSNDFHIQEINLITSRAGSVRGGHYHKYTYEIFVILEGEIKITLSHFKHLNATQTHIVTPYQCFYIKPFTLHTFEIIHDAKWLNGLSQKMNPNDKDFFTI